MGIMQKNIGGFEMAKCRIHGTALNPFGLCPKCEDKRREKFHNEFEISKEKQVIAREKKYRKAHGIKNDTDMYGHLKGLF